MTAQLTPEVSTLQLWGRPLDVRGRFDSGRPSRAVASARTIGFMKCPQCRHQVTFLETFEIMNPWSFACGGCKVPLRVGPRGDVIVALAAVAGGAPGLLFGYLWLVERLPLSENLSWSSVAFAALILPVQWLAVRFGDVQRTD